LDDSIAPRKVDQFAHPARNPGQKSAKDRTAEGAEIQRPSSKRFPNILEFFSGIF
jgi:hypothetical protein